MSDMELKKAITTRRSIRSYLDRPVPRPVMEKTLSLAVCAPSAGNSQPWRFIILDDPKIIEQCCRLNIDAYWGVRAPAGIVVCSDVTRHKHKGFWVQDCAAVTQNILLLLHEAGLGATWTGIHPEPDRVEGVRRQAELNPYQIPATVYFRPDLRATHPQRFCILLAATGDQEERAICVRFVAPEPCR